MDSKVLENFYNSVLNFINSIKVHRVYVENEDIENEYTVQLSNNTIYTIKNPVSTLTLLSPQTDNYICHIFVSFTPSSVLNIDSNMNLFNSFDGDGGDYEISILNGSVIWAKRVKQ